ncbi:MAG: hypothetical protein K0S07_185 [Chlamydiales bacterium]|jgi:spore maturation protein CgeB|nr:hypothetical protein [Chlamydiales bacterium]
MLRAYLIANTNMYDVKRYFTEKLVQSLERLGVSCRVLDIDEKGLTVQHIEEIRQFNPQFIASYHSQQPLPDGKFFWDYLKIPFLALLVDPAVYALPLFSSPNTWVTYIDQDDEMLLKAAGVKHSLFWPHAMDRELGAPVSQERPYDVVFFGSFYDHLELKKSWEKESAELLESALALFYQGQLSLLEALWQTLIERHIPLDSVDFAGLFFQLDYFMRGQDRLALLSSIRDASLHVFGDTHEETSFGRSWSDVLGQQKNITFHPAVNFAESLKILQKSKMALNHSPFFKGGGHERVFSAAMCGSLVISNESRWLQGQFSQEEMLFYSLQDKAGLNQQINALLADDSKRQNMAEKARQTALCHHTFDARAEELLEFILNAIHAE